MWASISRYCPTFSRIGRWLWDSPTFTTWGNYATQSLRLVFVTPLILTRFDETEVAAWYLFASLNFFGTVVTQRLGLTFTRMFAFAMGGASNLAPIKGRRETENEGRPNWRAFERAYGTIGTINLSVAWINVLVAVGLGLFALNNILEGYDSGERIWLAFGLMQLSSLVGFIFQHYAFALQGMNYVALNNRWAIIFSLVSVVGGGLTLLLGGGIIDLVLVMQGMMFLRILRNWFLLRHVQGGRVARMRAMGFDREVFGWAWEPIWKGFMGQLGEKGKLQIVAILYTAYGGKSDVAGFLFSLRMMETLSQVSQAPFTAMQPLMARLRSEGNAVRFKKIVVQRIALSAALLVVGIAALGEVFVLATKQFNLNIEFVSFDAWALLGFFMLISRINTHLRSVNATGNQVLYHWELAISALLSGLLMLWLGDQWSYYGPILIAFVPEMCLLNVRPLISAKHVFGGKT